MKNKLLYLITSLLFLSIFSMQGQSHRHKYGFRLGLNYSDLDFDDDAIVPGGDGEARYGFVAGFFAVYNLSDKISIQPEIQYSAQGAKSTNAEDFNGIAGQVSEDALEINLLQVPILLNYTIADKLTFSVGPQIGLRVWEWERDSDYETVQFSGVGGIGYHINDNITINLRGSFGITDAIDADNSESRFIQGDDPEPRAREALFSAKAVNHFVQFSVAYNL